MGTVMSCLSEILYVGEKFTLYLTCTCLIWCLIITIVVTLGMGIGLGYNYCYVDMKTKYRYVAGHYVYPEKPPYDTMRRLGRMEDHIFDASAVEEDSLRQPVPRPSDPRFTATFTYTVPTEALSLNNTFMADNKTTVFSDSKSVNGTESSVKDSKDVATTKLLQNTSLSTGSGSTSLPIRSSTIVSNNRPETEIIYDTDESTPESSIVNDTDESTPESLIVKEPTISNETDVLTPKPSIVNDPSNRKVKKLVIPISGLDLISLLSKLRAENKNYSLQIVTT